MINFQSGIYFFILRLISNTAIFLDPEMFGFHYKRVEFFVNAHMPVSIIPIN